MASTMERYIPRHRPGFRIHSFVAGIAGLALVACTAPATTPTIDASIHRDAVGQVVRTTGGVVVSQNELASRVGARILEEGGNAVDAAIATGLALAVVHPSAGNIGGGGFMVIRFPDGTATTFDFREKAPLASFAEMYVDENGEYTRDVHSRSPLAVGVPGTVAGFALAHEKYGRAEWASLVEPAVTLADGGFELTDALASSFANQVEGSMSQYPASVAKFSNNGTPYAAGEVWRQPDLARTLERIMTQGRDGFYTGETARLIAEEMSRDGGIITEEDLARYEAKEREPIRGTFNGYDIISMPPPSSGGVVLVEMLNILEGYDLKPLGQQSAEYIHYVTEAQRLGYRDRAHYLGDTDFVDVPIERLTSKEYAAELRKEIDTDRAGVSKVEDITLPYESMETTHYSVVDDEGMAVSVTYTLESGFGSKIVVDGGGFLLNNEMGDFNPWPGLTTESGQIGTDANLTRPEQRMLSSMSPTILARDGKLAAVIGSPGGRTIINTVLHLTLNLAEFDMSMEDAVAAPRTHHQWLPDRISLEENLVDPSLATELEAMGYTVSMSGHQGQAQTIGVDPMTGEYVAVPDPRSADAGAAMAGATMQD